MAIDRSGAGQAIRLVVNGEPRDVPSASTVADLVTTMGLGTSPCAVEVNKRVVPRREHGGHVLASGDRIEIVTLVGGG